MVILISFELKNTYVGIMPFLYPIYLWICVHIFCTNKYLLVACRATSASSSKYGLTSPIFYFITFPGKIAGNCFNVLFLNESSCFYQFVNYVPPIRALPWTRWVRGPQTPRLLTLPLTTNPGSTPDYTCMLGIFQSFCS
jgi:hypothetical protein